MKGIFKQLVVMIKGLPRDIEELLYDCATDLQASNIKSTSLDANEIWLI